MRRLLFLLLFLGLAFGQRVAVIGDWGQDTPGRTQVANLLRTEHARKPLAALLTAGDNFYPRGLVVERFLKELPPIPLYPAFGNHDAPNLRAQLERFGLERPYYRVRFGDLEVFVLYTEMDLAAQRAWLEESLRKSPAPFRILLLHRPLYSPGPHGGSPTLRTLLGPLLVRYRVGLVLAGHDHLYARTRVGGTVHVVTGGGGAGLYTPRPLPGFLVHKAHHALFLEVTPEGLWVYARDPRGAVLDRFLLTPSPP
ncbi:metallophosphoesterase [Thermus sp. NEB1569]|uniref:metallophosphoesterase family protein n=1 Tax=Thermus sp. NEB1569 TaxID=2918899 RepID=UPI001EFB692C|nr:metallophosphoesterase [Thermus sp. NEB1569]ULR41137.1 metallophosphoesterase [Thermus sp. NEB1569]